MLAPPLETNQQEQLETWVHQWGGAFSEAVLEKGFQYFQIPQMDGFIGYRVEFGCAIVIGDPICPNEQASTLAKAFQVYCEEKKYPIVYLASSENFSKWAIQNICNVLVQVGDELFFDPQSNPLAGSAGNRLRNKISHARHLGLSVQEYIGNDPLLEQAMVQVGEEWEKERKGPQIYLGKLHVFSSRVERRWFYVKQEEKIWGVALLCRLYAEQGWLLKFLITLPNSPRGTSELLMIDILETLKKEECHFLTYGMIPLEHLGEVIGIGRFPKWMAQMGFRIAQWIFKLDQKKVYWKKFGPLTRPAYVLFNKSIGIKTMYALMKSLKIEF